MTYIDLNNTDHGTVSEALFGGIYVNTTALVPDSSTDYGDHFETVFDEMGLTLLRFPGGEIPDGFVYDGSFIHNALNGGEERITSGKFKDMLFDLNIDPDAVTQQGLDALSNYAAISFDHADLVHPDLLAQGFTGFSDALAQAVNDNATFSFVMPSFGHMRPPSIDSGPYDADTHVKVQELRDDVYNFLVETFVEHKHGTVPDNFILEMGNETYSGWNNAHFDRGDDNNRDIFSAYIYSCLDAVEQFRDDYPAHVDSFDVSMQAYKSEGTDKTLIIDEIAMG